MISSDSNEKRLKPDLFELVLDFINPIQNSNETTAISMTQERKIINNSLYFSPELVDRLMFLLTLVEPYENIFFEQSQILRMRDTFKDKKIDLKRAPGYINNLRRAFSRANIKLATLLKFSSANMVNYTPSNDSSSMNCHNVYSKVFQVDYKLTKTSKTNKTKEIVNSHKVIPMMKTSSVLKNNSETNSNQSDLFKVWANYDRRNGIKVIHCFLC